MNYLENLDVLKNNKTVICLGIFDGLHKAHRNILNKTIELGKKFNLQTIFFTFKTDFNFKGKPFIFTDILKYRLVNDKWDFNYYYEFCLTKKENINMDKMSFLTFLKQKLNVQKIVIGEDFMFGKNRTGTIEDIINFFGKKNVIIFNLLKNSNNQKLSSSYIKELIIKNNFSSANGYLAYNYSCYGEVVKGNQYARKLGYNTANLSLQYKLLIESGIYTGITKFNNISYPSMVYYDKDQDKIESHLLNQNFNLYHSNIEIFFLEFLENKEKITTKKAALNKLKRCYNKTVIFFKNTNHQS